MLDLKIESTSVIGLFLVNRKWLDKISTNLIFDVQTGFYAIMLLVCLGIAIMAWVLLQTDVVL